MARAGRKGPTSRRTGSVSKLHQETSATGGTKSGARSPGVAMKDGRFPLSINTGGPLDMSFELCSHTDRRGEWSQSLCVFLARVPRPYHVQRQQSLSDPPGYSRPARSGQVLRPTVSLWEHGNALLRPCRECDSKHERDVL